MAQFRDGDVARKNGVDYVRRNGAWTVASPSADPYVLRGREREPAPQTAAQAEYDRLRNERARVGLQADQTRVALGQKALANADVPKPADEKRQSRIANMNALVEQIDRVQSLYDQDIAGQPATRAFGMTEFLPTPNNSRFNAAAAGLAEQGLAAFRVPGVGSQSDAELRQFVQANRPAASDYDLSIEEKLNQLRNRVDQSREQMGLDPASWNAAASPPPSFDTTPQRMMGPGQGGPGLQLSDGGSQRIDDPVLAGVNSKVNAMMKAGAPVGQIAKFVQDAGIPINEVLPALMQADAFRKKNPGYRGDYTVNIDDKVVPMSATRSLMAGLSNSDAGAYFANAADGLSMGTLDNLTSNPALTRAGLEGLRQQSPGASLAGTVTGGALAAGGAELAAGRLGLQGVRAAMAGDAAFGAAYGAGSADEGSRALGALGGAAAGAGGGEFGRRLASGTGRALTGARDTATRYLADRNIPLTMGQIAGQGGVVGRTIKGIEDKLESIPLLGDAIRARRAEGYRAFNREAFGQAVEPIGQNAAGEIGEDGVESAKDAVSDAYSAALSGVRVKPDNSFVKEMRAVIGRGSKLPGQMADEFRYALETHVAPELVDGKLTGEGFQAVRQALRQEAKEWKGKPRGNDYGNVLRQVEQSLERLVRRQAPDVVPALNRADKAHGRSKVVEDAVARGIDKGGVFTPHQLGGAAKASGKRFGGTQATTRRPFYELQRSAQDVLPSEVPNSGSVDRAWATAAVPALMGGAGYQMDLLGPEQAALLGALGLPYTRAGAKTLQKMLIERPEVVRRAGEQIIANRRVAGAIGAPLGVGLIPQR